jgi:hypothetical protein
MLGVLVSVFAGSYRGSEIDLSFGATGYPGVLPRIHTHPTGVAFSASNLRVVDQRLVGRATGDLRNAWQRQGDSYVVYPSGRMDKFTFQAAFDAEGPRQLGDFVEQIR